MSAKRHLSLVGGVIAAPFFIILILALISRGQPGVVPVCASFIIFLSIGGALIYKVPVRCVNPSCEGRMRPVWKDDKSVSGFKLLYKCPVCGAIHDTRFSFGGPTE
jgi:hypothetical protein